MLPLEARRHKKSCTLPNLMEKGLVILRSVASRDLQPPDWKLRPKQQSLSKSAQAINLFYRRKSEFLQNASSKDRTFRSEMEELRKMFLRRPGCPQFCTRATSMASYEMTSTVSLPLEGCLDSKAWTTTTDSASSQQASGTDADEPLLPFSKSACEFHYLRQKSDAQQMSPVTSSLVLGQSHLRRRVPWYISVIHEKDQCLSTLVEEVQRLCKLKVEVQKKDEEILALQEEREALKKKLRILLKRKGRGTFVCPEVKERQSEPEPKLLGRLGILKAVCKEEELQQWQQMQEESVLADIDGDLDAGGEEAEGLAGEAEGADEVAAGRKEAMGEEGEEEEGMEVELELDEEQEARQEKLGRRNKLCSPSESFEEELMAQLEEYEQVIQEFQFELGMARTRQSLATGACISLQREVDYLESQLQKVSKENELLQKELLERKQQLQAMTEKFSNLRDEKKQQLMMGLIEKDNLLLRQQVSELERELQTREQTIAESEAKLGQLQAQMSLCQNHLERRKQLQDQTQNKIEAAQQAEQQVRVTLESTQSRLERLRNKIIQAAFSASGIKALSTEISDNDVLDALQRIISERIDYYNQLRHKGFKVQPLQLSEVFTSPSKSKKVASK